MQITHFIAFLAFCLCKLTLAQQAGESCTIRRVLTPGICKDVSECPAVINRIRRRRPYTRCGFDGSTEIVCCASSVQTTTTTPAPELDENAPISQRKCKEYTEAAFEYVGALGSRIKVDKCGHKTVPLIVGGVKAKPREFPHMALLGFSLPNNSYTWSCGGTLVSEDYVLTAAHCLQVDGLGQPRKILLGDLDIFSDGDEAQPETFNVAETIRHPEYRTSHKYHDIGLIRLARRVKLNPYIRPACLPTTFDGPERQAIATGWGNTKHRGSGSSHLLKVTLTKYTHAECNETYQYIINRRFKDGIRDETQMCAGSKRERLDTCQGDSGGPLQVFHPHLYCMYSVIGVTSFGIACGEIDTPGVYTRVYPYLNWIESIVWKDA